MCHATGCEAKGNLEQFCQQLNIAVPEALKIKRFPRLLTISKSEEWPTDVVFLEAYRYLKRQIHFTQVWQPVVVTLWVTGTYLYR